MAKDNFIFKRVEKKYLLTACEREALLEKIAPMLVPDKYGHSTISSLYLDTPDFRIIRASIEAKEWGHAYKEKLRLRTYGTPTADSKTFLEIKKKFGQNAILKGMNLQEGATARERNDKIGGHKA